MQPVRYGYTASIAYLQDNGLTDYEQLEQKATAATERFHKLSDQIKSTEAALHTNMELKAATVQYAKTRPTFEKYKASKYSKKFLAEHEADRAWGTVYKLCKIFLRPTFWCCTIKVDIENSKGQYIEKDKQEATKDGSESTKIQHGI